jgi:hypothetical protein
VDYRHCALIINYDVEATVLDDDGDIIRQDKKSRKQLMRVPNLDEHTDILTLAEEIVSGSKLIHASKISRVRQLLSKLQDYILDGGEIEDGHGKEKRDRGDSDSDGRNSRGDASKANIENVGKYMEMLYDEDMQRKVEGTGCVLQLVKQHKYIEDLIQNDPLMSSLSRVLKEDYKHNMDLVLNIESIFFYFSRFSQMHDILIGKGVGGISLRILELEINRYYRRMEDMKELEQEMSKYLKSRNERKRHKAEKRLEKERKKTNVFVSVQNQVILACMQTLLNLSEDRIIERKMIKKGLVSNLVRLLERSNGNVLEITFMFLIKLSLVSENKDRMIELEAIRRIVKILDPNREKLTIQAVRLLYNLSLSAEARNQLIENAVVPRLVSLLRKRPFRSCVLRLLYVYSLPYSHTYIHARTHTHTHRYTLSAEDRCKSMFSYSDTGIEILLQLIVNFPNKKKLPPELGGLAINLTLDRSNCEKLVKGGKGLHAIMQRMCKLPQDSLLCAVVRNLSQWTYNLQQEAFAEDRCKTKTTQKKDFESKRGEGSDSKHDDNDDDDEDDDEDDNKIKYKHAGMWKHYIDPLLRVALKADSMPSGHDSLIHIFATLANFTSQDMSNKSTWATLIEKHNILSLIHGILVGGCENDIIQTCVMFLGTLALDKNCDILFCNSKIPSQLVEMLRTKRRDAGLLTQVLYTIYRMLRLPKTCSALLYSSNTMDAVCDCLKSSNDNVVSTADLVINLASDHDRLRAQGTLWEQFRVQRFQTHNREWVDMITEVDMDEGFVEEGKLYFDDEGSSVLGQSRDDSELDRLGGTGMTNDISLSASWRSDEGGGMSDSPRSRGK